MFRSKIIELIVGEFYPVVHCRILFMECSLSVIESVNGKVFSVRGQKNHQINSLGIVSGNDPVTNFRK